MIDINKLKAFVYDIVEEKLWGIGQLYAFFN